MFDLHLSILTLLMRHTPAYQARRNTSTARQMNPIPYAADYFGHKLHINQNEKL